MCRRCGLRAKQCMDMAVSTFFVQWNAADDKHSCRRSMSNPGFGNMFCAMRCFVEAEPHQVLCSARMNVGTTAGVHIRRFSVCRLQRLRLCTVSVASVVLHSRCVCVCVAVLPQNNAHCQRVVVQSRVLMLYWLVLVLVLGSVQSEQVLLLLCFFGCTVGPVVMWSVLVLGLVVGMYAVLH